MQRQEVKQAWLPRTLWFYWLCFLAGEHVQWGSCVSTDGLFNFLQSTGLSEPGNGLMLCHFGVTAHSIELSLRVLAELAPPDHRSHVVFLRFHQENLPILQGIAEQYPDRAHVPESLNPFAGLCSAIVLSMADPRFTTEEIQLVSRSTGVVLSHFASPCQGNEEYACRYFSSTWQSMVDEQSTCGEDFCAALLSDEHLQHLHHADPWLAALDCDAMLGAENQLSATSQWQQDWFAYINFVRGTELDVPRKEGEAQRQGVYVDIGAFHPVHLSNTFFFERCLGWRGVCAEPNPNWVPYFNAYRPRCKLVRNCAWSRPRDVLMSFHKDPIEAYIQEDGSGDFSASGAVLINGEGAKPRFTASCRTLEDILTSNGLQKPSVVDYMSVDAEAAEVEIFRDFPFHKFDIRVINVEVQAKNYYDLDVIFSMAQYAKVAVLGGDHVYAKLDHGLTMPKGASDWHSTLSKNFHAYVKPQTVTLQ
mmetsp:Transcript_88094/g.184109  ORF Transcript_88094/g.184109 Transcript_88094/m.184109 type:complete len:476 (+) Transcript_88094:127-1554(+)